MLAALITVLGLMIYESVTSVDNAIINAQVLSTMQKKARRWFLTWGMFIAVFVVRGVFPLVIVWLFNPSLGLWGTLTATFSGNEQALAAIEQSAPYLLAGAGIFLILLFNHWLLLEEKHFGLPHESKLQGHTTIYYAILIGAFLAITYLAMDQQVELALSFTIGFVAFFVVTAFKMFAEQQEKKLLTDNSSKSDLSKVIYLEAIDTTFSIDGVLGAFAFTLSIPLILIGNGLGAIVVRQLTIHNVERIKHLPYLKNGAMYSIFLLGSVMIGHAFGLHIPEWVSPICTIAIVGYFFWRSVKARSTRLA